VSPGVPADENHDVERLRRQVERLSAREAELRHLLLETLEQLAGRQRPGILRETLARGSGLLARTVPAARPLYLRLRGRRG